MQNIPGSPEYSPTSVQPTSPTYDSPPVLRLDSEYDDDDESVQKCRNIIQHEPGGVLVSTLMNMCSTKKENMKTFLGHLLDMNCVDIVCYPTPPSLDHHMRSVSFFLKTYRDHEASVFDVRKQFPRITDNIWSQLVEMTNFCVSYYGSKQYIRLRTVGHHKRKRYEHSNRNNYNNNNNNNNNNNTYFKRK
jgi:hypothetical protein